MAEQRRDPPGGRPASGSDAGVRKRESAATAAFTEHRGLLFTVAYEMLGSAVDAEDVLQDSWLRWSEVRTDTVHDPRAYLVRIVTRLSLNRLRTLRRRREDYVGPWLPEPLVTTPDVLEDVALANSVSFAMLLVLETLTPLERAVFLLREVFGFSHDEIAAATDRSPAAVRQVASRARNHVQARRPRVTPPEDTEQITARFLAAATGGGIQPLMDLLAPDVVLLSDGGGKRQAALRPLHGADRVARWLAGVMRKEGFEFSVEWAVVNGALAVKLHVDGQLDSIGSLVTEDGLITEIYLVRNPDKLARVCEVRTLRR